MQLKNTPRKNAVQILNWFQSQSNFQELEENNWLEIYHSAMQWFEANLGNSNYVELEEIDIECLLALRQNSHTVEELVAVVGLSSQAIRQKMFKLVTRGFVISYLEDKAARVENRKTYYKLSPYGYKFITNYVLEHND